MRSLFVLAAGASLFALAPAPAAASQEQLVRCVVRYGGVTYNGRCSMLVEGERESFDIAPASRRYFVGRVHAIGVAILPGNVAQVSGYSRADGRDPWADPLRLPPPAIRTHHWGAAVRSVRDRNCWIGRGFSICTYRAALSGRSSSPA